MICSLKILSGEVGRIKWRWALIPLLYAMVGLAYSLYGVIVGAPGAVRVMTVMVIYPLLLSIIAFTYVEEDAGRIFRTLLLAAWILVAVDLIYILSNIVFPDNIFSSFVQGLYEENAVIDDAEDYFKFTIPNISSLVFLFPFFISVFFSRSNFASRAHIVLLLLFMAILSIASGRRALFVAAIVGPVAAFLLLVLAKPERLIRLGRSSKIIYLIVLVGVVVFLGYSFDLFDFYFDQIASIFDLESNESNRERALQFDSLVNGIEAAPFFGNGAGAAASYSRSQTQPWAYELSYLALLFQYGILGFLIYFFGVAFLAFKLMKAVRKNGDSGFEYFFLSGFIAFLIANATNPYLGKFDYMWIIFIPYAIFANENKRRK